MVESLEQDIRPIREGFYRHLTKRGLSDAYAASLANDERTMARYTGPFPTTGEMRDYYQGMLKHGQLMDVRHTTCLYMRG